MERGFQWMVDTYEGSLAWALDHGRLVLLVLAGTIALNVYLYGAVPKGFFPQQDTGLLIGGIQVDQASSFELTSQKFRKLVAIVKADPAVENVTAFSQSAGGFMFASLKPKNQRPNESSDQVINRIRPKTFKVAGAQLFLQSSQDIRFGGRQSNAQYQYTLQSDDLEQLKTWAKKLEGQLKKYPQLTDVNSDQQENGLESYITVDRDAAARYGLTSAAVDNILNDAFSQRLAAVIYNPLNTYHVVMEVAPQWATGPTALDSLYIQPGSDAVYSASTPVVGSAASAERLSSTAFAANQAIPQGAVRPANIVSVVGGAAANSQTGTVAGPSGAAVAVSTSSSGASTTGAGSATASGSSTGATGSGSPLNGAGVQRATTGGAVQAQTGSAIATTVRRAIPLSSIASYAPNATAVSISHQGQTVSTTVSFNLAPGMSLSDAQTVIKEAQDAIQMPSSVQGSFRGTAQIFQDTLNNQPLLILTALVAVYIVLGVLYESYIHPITVLSTLPSAGIGALLALMLLHMEFDIIALIGVILLIGIVKKNAIMIIDFALVAERERGLSSKEAIYEASLLRFRPILMTTMAAILGALPLAIGFGEGSEIRRPLGVSIMGGLIASQILTLITTPVVYLYMDKLRRPSRRRKGPERWSPGAGPAPSPIPAPATP
jgi:multidrug efflux pump